MKSWYKKESFINDLKLNNEFNYCFDKKIIKALYLWDRNTPLRKVMPETNVLYKVDVLSDDLDSIDIKNIKHLANKNRELLEEEGYDFNSIKFSSFINSFKKNFINSWALTSDNKIYFYGQEIDDEDELNSLQKDAINYANSILKIKTRKDLSDNPDWSRVYLSRMETYNNTFGWSLINVDIKTIKNVLEKLL